MDTIRDFPTQECMDAVAGALDSMSRDLLRFPGCRMVGPAEGLPPGGLGAYLPLISPDCSIYVGLVAARHHA